ncbi:MAG: hypothetical protein R3E14_09430 [Erythrobacter sp.]
MKDFIFFAAAELGSKEVRQFKQSLERPRNEFHRRVIVPQFYNPSTRSYMGLSFDQWLAGRNHRIAKCMKQACPEAWGALTFFTNPLSLPAEPKIEDGCEVWTPPSDRVVWGKSQVMTFEFDKEDIGFLSEQLRWCRSSTGKVLDCPIGDLFRFCSRWVDFEGITVNYSGNKSLHIHIVFTTALAQAQGMHANLRSGITHHWERLSKEVERILKPGIAPDSSLRFPEQFRRIPNGVRVLDKPNILGAPIDCYVPQVTLWEKFRDRAAKGVTASFFDPTFFVETVRKIPTKADKKFTPLPEMFELDFWAQKMRATFNEANYPAFYDFVEHQGSIRARFTNHAGDRNPSSFMDADHRTVLINGANPLNLSTATAPHLPRTLGEMIEVWSDEYQCLNTRDRSPIEQAFAIVATDKDAARCEMSKLLMRVIRDEKLAFVCAPEGITKTTGLFDNHARIERWLRAEDDGTVMYAFADYKSAVEKAAEFNQRHKDGGFRGVVLESFDRAYERACDELGLKKLTPKDVENFGKTSVWSTIECLQSQVFEVFKKRHAAIWSEVGNATPVFFTVHAVAHNWPLSSRSRMMWAPSFWHSQEGIDHAVTCRQETKLSLLIHDEIKDTDLVAAYRASKLAWVEGLIKADPDAWRDDRSSVTKLASFQSYKSIHPNNGDISFEETQDIAAFLGHEWDRVFTRDSGEYPEPGKGYAAAINQEWCIIERRWPQEAASRTLVLTTEAVPVKVAESCNHGWTILDLDTPQIERDAVRVFEERGVTGDNLPSLCAKRQADDPGLFIVSNRVASLPNTMTHASARGSNRLIGKRVLQTMTFVTPGEYEKLEALNAWTGLNCLIRHRHIDEFNQTAGRNLGFRYREGATHDLLVNQRLYNLLDGAPRARARYSMERNPTRHQKLVARMEDAPSKNDLKLLRRKLRREPPLDDCDDEIAMAA